MKQSENLILKIKNNFPSGLVVFLVALPLCLGVAIASDAPPIAGIIAGIIGGIVVGFFSNSQLSVSGPAAGLTAIVASAISELGSFETFLMAVIIAGLIQILLGFLRAGFLSSYFPTSVIEGMLSGIGIIIIMKQIPHAFGYDVDSEGDFYFIEKTGSNTLNTLIESLSHIHIRALMIALIALFILISWDKINLFKKLKFIPNALIAVVIGILINEIFVYAKPPLAILSENHLVKIPSLSEIKQGFSFPDFNNFLNPNIWKIGATIAIVASIETLLSLEATDKMDPLKRYSDANQELKAQGIGNLVSGLLGGLPITSVIVRSSTNINFGATSKLSSIIHGFFLLISVLAIPFVLNKIPLAVLASILILIGCKLATPKNFKHMWSGGMVRFVPFLITVLGVVFIDLLKGVGLGLLTSIGFILYENFKMSYTSVKEKNSEGNVIKIHLAQEVSFLNRATIKNTLFSIPEKSNVIIDASNSNYIDFDVIEILKDFKTITSKEKKINLKMIGFQKKYGFTE